MSAEPVRLERSGDAAIVVIDRPERSNALSRDAVAALGRIGAELARSPRLRAIVLTGAGDRAFSAGADLKERRDLGLDEVRDQLNRYRTDLGWIERSEVLVVAAINGFALGGGLELALMCDLRVAAEHAELGLPETRLGIIPGAGGTQRLPRLIGAARAKELILLGRRVSAREACSIGLVNRVSPSGTPVVPDTLEWIAPILQGAPLAQRAALRAIRGAASLPLAEGLALELECYDPCLHSEDRVEALAAFADQRAPRFQGR